MTDASSFFPDALEPNRAGDLSDTQRRNLGAMSNFRRRNALTTAALAGAFGLLIAFGASSRTPLVQRQLVAGGAFVVAAFFLVRSITGNDPLTRDLRESRVESVEGAIGKRRIGGGRARDTYFLDVGDRAFTVGQRTFHGAPDAGWVRVYYLPLSRKIVNLERIPNASPAPDMTRDGIVRAIGATLSGNRREANEARASIAGVGEALKAAFDGSAQPPSTEARDPRPLDVAILGTWTNPFIRVTFSEAGLASVHTFGGDKTGRWSVDADGKLRAGIMGHEQSVDAWVAGDTLTIIADGQTVAFTREPL